MRYPYLLFDRPAPQPIFRDLAGPPLILDLESREGPMGSLAPRDQRGLQRLIESRLEHRGGWGLSGYLEDRRLLLAECPQMIGEGRFYHLGLDIIVPEGTPLHAPLPARVAQTGYEEGAGNFGGFVLLEHALPGCERFFSLYGHLSLDSLPAVGTSLTPGEPFARIGGFSENGDWFYHTHLQILSPEAVNGGWVSKGYCAAADLPRIPRLCPDPLPLFRT